MDTEEHAAPSKTQLVSITEAGRRLSLSPWTIRAHAKKGTIKSIRCGKRVLIPVSELNRILTEGLPSLRASARPNSLFDRDPTKMEEGPQPQTCEAQVGSISR